MGELARPAQLVSEENFFTRFSEAVDECQRLQAQCRFAAEAAPKTEDSVDLSATQRSVQIAKETASYAKTSIRPDSPRAGTPECLKHLSEPPREHLIHSGAGVFGVGTATETGGAEAVVLAKESCGNEASDEAVAGSPGIGDEQPHPFGVPNNATSAAEEPDPARGENSETGSNNENEMGVLTGAGGESSPPPNNKSAVSTLEGETGKKSSSRGSSKDKTSELGEDDAENAENNENYDDSGRKWRARPPALRFKTRMQFSERFRPSETKSLLEDANADLQEKVGATHEEIKDPLVGWVNTVFALSIETEYEFVIAFPLLVLTVLDAVYPKRVRWERIDWRIQYKRALLRNYREVELLWQEVNMEKSREFRFDMTALRVEQLFAASLEEKMMFLRLLKRWFDTRIHHGHPYDPIRKRAEFADACRLRGLPVTFPSWMKVDKEIESKIAQGKKSGRYRELPEYMRLICFLGSPEHQNM